MFATAIVGSFVLARVFEAQASTSAAYTPNQIRTAYGFNLLPSVNSVATDGTGETIAIVDSGNAPTIQNDLTTFSTHYGLPISNTTLSVVSETGGSVASLTTSTDAETTLDVEYAHAIAPGAKILLVESQDLSFTHLNAAVQYAAKQPGVVDVSMSYGAEDYAGTGSGSETGYDSVYTNPAGHANVAYIASSGDSSTPSYPALSPNVLAVGGTNLQLNSDNTYKSESAWSGSGGGTSVAEPKPGYQKNVQNTSYRTNPDVAYDADPNTGVIIYDSTPDTVSGTTYSGYYAIGGTSAGAPQWAALIALADQIRGEEGLAPLTTDSSVTDGDMNLLYKMYNLYLNNKVAYNAAFHDITTGSNTAETGYPAQAAATGYDEVTGLGSPIANDLVPFLGDLPEPTSAAVFLAGSAVLLKRSRRKRLV